MKRPQLFRPPGALSREASKAAFEARRESAASRGYDWLWRKESAVFKASHPLCVMCLREGRTAAAEVVDHIVPHRGDMALFWDRSNWQALCAPHHNREKQRQEHAMARQGIGG